MTSLVSSNPQQLDSLVPMQQDYEGEHYFPEHSLGHHLDEVAAVVQTSTTPENNPEEPYEEYDSEDDEDLWSSDDDSQGENSAGVLHESRTSDNPQVNSGGHKTVSLKTITAQDFYYDEKQLELDSHSHILAIAPLENGNPELQRSDNLFLAESSPSGTENASIFVPRDVDNLEKMKRVLMAEFDNEMEYKKNELEQIERRLKEAESLWKRLQKIWTGKQFDPQILQLKKSENGKRKKKKKSSSYSTKTLYARTPDGGYVKLQCPVCKRQNFITQLGFVNHCRIRHKVKFASYEDAAKHCGIPVDESEVPPDDPARLNKPLSFFVNQKKSEVELHYASLIPESVIKAEEKVNAIRKSEHYTECSVVTKRVIVGNTSKLIPPEARKKDSNATHKWMVYVRGPREEPEIERFVQRVKFILHDSFAPNHKVVVTQPPFQVTRKGWGEFVVRVRLYFWDPKAEPVDIDYELKLDFSTVGLQVLGREQPVDIELDADFFEKHIAPYVTQKNDRSLGNGNTPSPPTTKFAHAPFMNDDLIEERPTKRLKMSLEEIYQFIRTEAETTYPLLSETKAGKLPFSCAKTIDQWRSWSLGKRKSSEWQRARQIRIRLEEELNVPPKEWSTRRVMEWLRKEGLTPTGPQLQTYEELYESQLAQYDQLSMRQANKKTLAKKLCWCRVCGCPHFPPDQFDELERLCAERRRVAHTLLNTYSTFHELMTKSHLAPTVNPMWTPLLLHATKLLSNRKLSPAMAAHTPSLSLLSFAPNNSPPSVNGTNPPESTSSSFISGNVTGDIGNNTSKVNVTSNSPKTAASPSTTAPIPVDTWSILSAHSMRLVSDEEANWLRNEAAVVGAEVDDVTKLTESVLMTAAALFVQSLVAESLVVYSKERNGDLPTERQFKVLTPLHIVAAILQNPNFDFLTNHGLEKKET
jgi:phage FluMu protein Com